MTSVGTPPVRNNCTGRIIQDLDLVHLGALGFAALSPQDRRELGSAGQSRLPRGATHVLVNDSAVCSAIVS
jgi:hypothetical protein